VLSLRGLGEDISACAVEELEGVPVDGSEPTRPQTSSKGHHRWRSDRPHSAEQLDEAYHHLDDGAGPCPSLACVDDGATNNTAANYGASYNGAPANYGAGHNSPPADYGAGHNSPPANYGAGHNGAADNTAGFIGFIGCRTVVVGRQLTRARNRLAMGLTSWCYSCAKRSQPSCTCV